MLAARSPLNVHILDRISCEHYSSESKPSVVGLEGHAANMLSTHANQIPHSEQSSSTLLWRLARVCLPLASWIWTNSSQSRGLGEMAMGGGQNRFGIPFWGVSGEFIHHPKNGFILVVGLDRMFAGGTGFGFWPMAKCCTVFFMGAPDLKAEAGRGHRARNSPGATSESSLSTCL